MNKLPQLAQLFSRIKSSKKSTLIGVGAVIFVLLIGCVLVVSKKDYGKDESKSQKKDTPATVKGASDEAKLASPSATITLTPSPTKPAPTNTSGPTNTPMPSNTPEPITNTPIQPTTNNNQTSSTITNNAVGISSSTANTPSSTSTTNISSSTSSNGSNIPSGSNP